jgi:hypothetical protein
MRSLIEWLAESSLPFFLTASAQAPFYEEVGRYMQTCCAQKSFFFDVIYRFFSIVAARPAY